MVKITSEDLNRQQQCCENLKSYNITEAKFEVFIGEPLGTQIFCNVMLCNQVNAPTFSRIKEPIICHEALTQ
jgi:hypothetical protein